MTVEMKAMGMSLKETEKMKGEKRRWSCCIDGLRPPRVKDLKKGRKD